MEIFGTSEELLVKEQREKITKSKIFNKELKFCVVFAKQNFSDETLKLLLKVKELLQIQLPKMPRDYILKQVFDEKHRTLCMFSFDELIGVICFRPFYSENFTEMVFLAINFNSQIQGYGAFLVYVFKEYFKNSIYNKDLVVDQEIFWLDIDNFNYKPIDLDIYIITYADNSALGFFKKQGFKTIITFDKWIGRIKDYEGGTLVECKLFWEVNYINNFSFINLAEEEIFSKIQNSNELKKIRGPIQNNQLKILDEISFFKDKIKQISNIENLERHKPIEKVLFDFLEYFISDLSSNANSWPFLEPVDQNIVPDYYRVIKKPMDLLTMQNKLEKGFYKNVNEFEDDFYLIISNCYSYNAINTQYYKCAQNFEEYFQKRMKIFKMKWFLKKD